MYSEQTPLNNPPAIANFPLDSPPIRVRTQSTTAVHCCNIFCHICSWFLLKKSFSLVKNCWAAFDYYLVIWMSIWSSIEMWIGWYGIWRALFYMRLKVDLWIIMSIFRHITHLCQFLPPLKIIILVLYTKPNIYYIV